MGLLIIQYITVGCSNLEDLTLCTVAWSMCDHIFHLKRHLREHLETAGFSVFQVLLCVYVGLARCFSRCVFKNISFFFLLNK